MRSGKENVNYLKAGGMMLATTMGAGIFALPALLPQAGWLLVLIYALVLASLIAITHDIYLRIRVHKLNQGLLGLISHAWGKMAFYPSFLVVIGGLLLTLLIYMILGGSFLQIIFPGLSAMQAVLLTWFLGVAPFVFGSRRILSIELAGALVMGFLVMFVLWDAPQLELVKALPIVKWQGLFLPFGVLLFSLAGWTAVEPVEDDLGLSKKLPQLGGAMMAGTFLAVLLYALFALGVIGSGGGYGEESFVGVSWSYGQQLVFSFLGLVLVLTSFWPIAMEVRRSFLDTRFSKFSSNLLTFATPLVLYFAGWHSFLSVMEVTGGVFLSVQYFIIVMLGLKLLKLTNLERWGLRLLSVVFLLGMVAAVSSWLI